MSNEVQQLLSDQHRGIYRTQGILCYLFRHALHTTRMDISKWNAYTRLFFEKPHNKNNPDKGNLNKALTQDDFTWAAFKKAVDFLNPISAVLIVTLTWRSGKQVSYPIVIDPAENEEDAPINTFGDDHTPTDVFTDSKPPVNTLARLFRRIIREENINLPRWNALFEQYVKNPDNGIPQNRRDITTIINTMQRDLLNPRMSWNVFRKGIQILNPLVEDYQLELRWSKEAWRDPITLHRVTIRDPLSIKPKTLTESIEDEIVDPHDVGVSGEIDLTDKTPTS